jgi:transposase InsO family protein
VGHRITGRYPGAVNRHHGIGWEFVHVCIDDASRIAFVQVLVDQRKESAVAFLEAAAAYFAKLNVRIERVMTDNGSCYRSKMFRVASVKSSPGRTLRRPMERLNASFRRHCANGAYARAYHSAELLHWLHRYNWHRPHGSLKANAPTVGSVYPRTTY